MLIHRAAWARVVSAGALLIVGGCASAGTTLPAYQVTTHTAAPPPLAPPVTASIAGPRSPESGPPSLPPARSAIVGMPSTRVSDNANGSDVAQSIPSGSRQRRLSPIIDP